MKQWDRSDRFSVETQNFKYTPSNPFTLLTLSHNILFLPQTPTSFPWNVIQQQKQKHSEDSPILFYQIYQEQASVVMHTVSFLNHGDQHQGNTCSWRSNQVLPLSSGSYTPEITYSSPLSQRLKLPCWSPLFTGLFSWHWERGTSSFS